MAFATIEVALHEVATKVVHNMSLNRSGLPVASQLALQRNSRPDTQVC